MLAARAGSVEVIETLLAARADVEATDLVVRNCVSGRGGSVISKGLLR